MMGLTFVLYLVHETLFVRQTIPEHRLNFFYKMKWSSLRKAIYSDIFGYQLHQPISFRFISSFLQVTAILTFLSFAINFELRDQNFQNSKGTKMLQKNFEVVFTKIKIYLILCKLDHEYQEISFVQYWGQSHKTFLA